MGWRRKAPFRREGRSTRDRGARGEGKSWFCGYLEVQEKSADQPPAPPQTNLFPREGVSYQSGKETAKISPCGSRPVTGYYEW